MVIPSASVVVADEKKSDDGDIMDKVGVKGSNTTSLVGRRKSSNSKTPSKATTTTTTTTITRQTRITRQQQQKIASPPPPSKKPQSKPTPKYQTRSRKVVASSEEEEDHESEEEEDSDAMVENNDSEVESDHEVKPKRKQQQSNRKRKVKETSEEEVDYSSSSNEGDLELLNAPMSHHQGKSVSTPNSPTQQTKRPVVKIQKRQNQHNHVHIHGATTSSPTSTISTSSSTTPSTTISSSTLTTIESNNNDIIESDEPKDINQMNIEYNENTNNDSNNTDETIVNNNNNNNHIDQSSEPTPSETPIHGDAKQLSTKSYPQHPSHSNINHTRSGSGGLVIVEPQAPKNNRMVSNLVPTIVTSTCPTPSSSSSSSTTTSALNSSNPSSPSLSLPTISSPPSLSSSSSSINQQQTPQISSNNNSSSSCNNSNNTSKAVLLQSTKFTKLHIESLEYKFTVYIPSLLRISNLKTKIATEFRGLFGNILNNPLSASNIEKSKLKDQFGNDLSIMHNVGDLLCDNDVIIVNLPQHTILYPFIFPSSNPPNSLNNSTNNTSIINSLSGNNQVNDSFKNSNYLRCTTSGIVNSLLGDTLSPTTTSNVGHIYSPPLTPLSPVTPTSNLPGITPIGEQHQSVPMSPSKRETRPQCMPYCELATDKNTECLKCNEMRPMALSNPESSLCTKWCITNGSRKMKTNNSDFCSICFSRHRTQKYPLKLPHQCVECQRPWMILVQDGKCRRCVKEAEKLAKLNNSMNSHHNYNNYHNNMNINHNNYNNNMNVVTQLPNSSNTTPVFNLMTNNNNTDSTLGNISLYPSNTALPIPMLSISGNTSSNYNNSMISPNSPTSFNPISSPPSNPISSPQMPTSPLSQHYTI